MQRNLNDYQTHTRKILKECKAFVDGGHFVYSSGRHGDFYINKDALYMYPKKLDDVAYMLAQTALNAFSVGIDVVLAPTMGGVLIGQSVAYTLSLELDTEVLFAYSEPKPGNSVHRVIRRNYDAIIQGKSVLLVDDIVTTGATMVGMARAVLRMGGNVVGAVSICDRGKTRCIKFYPGPDSDAFELNMVPLLELDLRTWPSDDCPLCKAGRPVDPRLGEGTGFFMGDDPGRVPRDTS